MQTHHSRQQTAAEPPPFALKMDISLIQFDLYGYIGGKGAQLEPLPLPNTGFNPKHDLAPVIMMVF
jgi:hypothetical protein